MGEWSIEPAKWQADISPLANEALWGGLSQAPPWGMPDETLRGGCPVPSLQRGQIPPLSPRACPFLEPLHSLFARDRVAHAPGCPRRRDRILNHCGYVDPARRIGHILLAAGEHLLAPLVLLPDHLVRLAANDMRTRREEPALKTHVVNDAPLMQRATRDRVVRPHLFARGERRITVSADFLGPQIRACALEEPVEHRLLPLGARELFRVVDVPC